MRKNLISKNVLITIAALLVVFVVDMFLPNEIAEGVLYILCFIFIIRESKTTIAVFSGIIILLIVFKFDYFHGDNNEWYIIYNRLLSIFVVIIATIMAMLYRDFFVKANEQKEKQIRLLEQKTEEYDNLNSAINKYLLFTISDLQGYILYANDKFCEVTEYKREEVTGQNHKIISSSYHSKEFWNALYENAVKGNPWHAEVLNKSKEGNLFWSDTTAFPIYNKDGKLEKYFCLRIPIDEKKRQEQVIKESLAFSNGILQSVPSGILVVNTEGTIISANKAWNEFIERSESSIFKKAKIGANHFEICKEEIANGNSYAEKALNGLKAVLNRETDFFKMEFCYQFPTHEYWLNITITGFEGYGFNAVINHEDITENKNRENRIIENENRLKHAHNLAKLGSWETDFKTNKTTFSDEFLQIYGYEHQNENEFVNSWLSKINKDKFELVNETTDEESNNVQKFSYFHRIFRPDNTVRHLFSSINYEYNPQGKPVKLFGLSQDITEIKEKDAEIEKLAEINRRLIDSSDELFYIVKTGGKQKGRSKLLFLSKKSEEFLGIDPETFVMNKEKLLNFVHPDDHAYLIGKAKQLYNSKSDDVRIYRLRNIKNNEYIWVYDYIKVVVSANGEIEEFFGSMKNITELKNREIDLEKTAQDLNNRYNELMQFNYIVSHNLRAPVANILGMISVLDMPDILEADKEVCLRYINASAGKMDEVIKDLTHILESRSAINQEKLLVSLPQLLQSITDTLERQIKESDTTLKTYLDIEALEIFTIKGYIESILYNFINNAIKYKSKYRKPEINICSKKENKNIIISVEDNGIGIDLDKHGHHIFGLYKRFHLDVEGKGIGLYMIKSQVETLGGTIKVESELGKGTKFIISLPLE